MRFAERMKQFSPGVFSRLAAVKQEALREGRRIIDFSVGAPNIPPAPHVLEALTRAAAAGENYVYALDDLPELRAAAAAWYKRRFDVALDPETEVTSLLGSQDGLAHLCLTFVDPGDVVLVPEPCYPVFADGPRLAGAEVVFMPQRPENNWLIDLDAIPAETARRAKLMIVCYPNNPTTAVAPPGFYEKLVEFAQTRGIAVLHDNAYCEMVFAGGRGGSFLSVPGARDIGLEFNSLSKTYGLAGARVGFALGNREMIARLRLLKSNFDFGVFLPVQKAAIAALNGPQDCVAATCAAYERRRDLLAAEFTRIGWPVAPSPATMFVWAKIPPGFRGGCEYFAEKLVRLSGVIVIPGTAFGPSGEGYVRIALVRSEAEITAAAEAMAACGLLRELKGG
ncbi:MAG: aminotransferase class I/II-fold pyridoxal phosphate-dependent enzyme [Gracilibacteraceae bacterium]|jgi:LL-diaminopimelate aminotransferase|nr:aminotransferase class I/II-fold pyridoxal phosphate-dependent enzyme [Gracilibacteraceae bacterium]